MNPLGALAQVLKTLRDFFAFWREVCRRELGIMSRGERAVLVGSLLLTVAVAILLSRFIGAHSIRVVLPPGP